MLKIQLKYINYTQKTQKNENTRETPHIIMGQNNYRGGKPGCEYIEKKCGSQIEKIQTFSFLITER